MDCDCDSNVIAVLIQSAAEKKLKERGVENLIHTRRREGYVLEDRS